MQKGSRWFNALKSKEKVVELCSKSVLVALSKAEYLFNDFPLGTPHTRITRLKSGLLNSG